VQDANCSQTQTDDRVRITANTDRQTDYMYIQYSAARTAAEALQ